MALGTHSKEKPETQPLADGRGPQGSAGAQDALATRGSAFRLLLLRDGRPALQLTVGRAVLAAFVVFCLLPASAGAMLRVGTGQRVHPFALVLHDHLSEMGVTARLVPYLVVPEGPEPVEPLPPRIPEVVLPEEPATPEHRRGHLRVYSLHLKEEIDVVPFDEEGRPVRDAFEQIENLWRCRITGHTVRIHPRLVRVLTAINDLYDRPLQLISGHRVPGTRIGTSPTSQHTVGNAADVRVAGVPTEELRALAKKLGARGVGLYPEDRFVHVDFRPGRRYFWTETDENEAQEPSRMADSPRAPEESGPLASASSRPGETAGLHGATLAATPSGG